MTWLQEQAQVADAGHRQSDLNALIWPQDSLIDLEDDGCGDADGRREGVCASVIAGVDASPTLELSQHVLDPVALLKDRAVVRDERLAVGL